MTFTPKDWRNAIGSTGGGDETTPLNAVGLEDLETRVTDYADLAASDAYDDANTYTDSAITTLQAERMTIGALITDATYTLVAADDLALVRMSSGSAQTVTVPDDVFQAGSQVLISQIGAGVVTISAGAGMTLLTPATSTITITAQYGQAVLTFTAVDTCLVNGDVE